MKSLAVRLTLVGLFVIAAGTSAYLFWMGETQARAGAWSARAFDAETLAAARSVLELRSAQEAYVAAGQGDDFWSARVTASLGSLVTAMGSLRTAAVSPEAQSEIDAALGSLQKFEQMDRRARDYARSGQKLLASDLIFADGIDTTAAAVAALDRARDAEGRARDDGAQGIRRRQLYALGAAAAAAVLAVLLLAPRASEPRMVLPVDRRVGAADRGRTFDIDGPLDEGWSPPRKITPQQAAPPVPVPMVAVPPPVAEELVRPPQPQTSAAPSFDIGSVASICTELARVADTQSLPAILERAATLLDASGIVLWIADPDGREMSPVITHGYPPQVVARLGTLPRDAENATAAAFRTSLLQTVRTSATSAGAIAAPLVTSGGCVGVMAAEVRQEGEKNASTLAAATIVAAQLAALAGPPAVRQPTRVEAAGM